MAGSERDLEEQHAAIEKLSKKTRADRQFFLNRLEAAFSRCTDLEVDQRRLDEEIKELRENWRREKEEKERYATELSIRLKQLDQVLSRVDALEKLLAANPYLAFSRAANSPKAKDDPFNVDFLANPTSLAKEASFAFNMPLDLPNSAKTPNVQQENETTWDLLNLGDNMPPLSDAIRQSFFNGPQDLAKDRASTNEEFLSTKSDLGPDRAYSGGSSETMANSRTDLMSHQTSSRVMSTSSLPLLGDFGPPSSTGDFSQYIQQTPEKWTGNNSEISGHPVQLSPEALGNSEYYGNPPENIPSELIGYPQLFESKDSVNGNPANENLANEKFGPLPTQNSEGPVRTSFTAQLNRRKGTLHSQRIRFEQMCEVEANNVEQEVVRSNVFEALSKSGELMKASENLMIEAERADEELGRFLGEFGQNSDRTEVQKSLEIRASKARNILETSYSRLCSSLDFATQQQNCLTIEQKAQRSSSSALKSLKQLLKGKDSDVSQNQEEGQNGRESLRPNLHRNSTQSHLVRPAAGLSYTSPLITAVNKLNTGMNVSPQRPGRSESGRNTHRRAVSDIPQFPQPPEPIRPPKEANKTERESKNGRISETELLALISELEERRLALYRN